MSRWYFDFGIFNEDRHSCNTDEVIDMSPPADFWKFEFLFNNITKKYIWSWAQSLIGTKVRLGLVPISDWELK